MTTRAAGPDTIGLRTEGVFRDSDEARLSAAGFRPMKDFGVKKEPDEPAFLVSRMFHREDDGARVWIEEKRGVRVEASVPRVLGLTNERQAQLSVRDFGSAVRALTVDLMPDTSGEAPWFTTRLDVAANFEGDVAAVVGAHACARHGKVRSAGKQYFGESVSWLGQRRQFVIYDKGLEMEQGKKGGPGPGVLGRMEARWMGLKGLDDLGADLMSCGGLESGEPAFLLPFSFKLKEKRRERGVARVVSSRLVAGLGLGESWADQLLRMDLARVEGVKEGLFEVRTLRDLGALFVLTHPEETLSYWHGMPKATRWRAEKKVQQLRASWKRVSLVGLVWGEAA